MAACRSLILASLSVFLTGAFLIPQTAYACYCAQKPDGQYICETHCAQHEIDNFLGPDHGPIQYVTNYLTGNFLPPGVPIPGTSSAPDTNAAVGNADTAGTPPGATAGGSGTSNTTPSCYMTSTGDYVCPQDGTNGAVDPNNKPGIGAQMPQPANNNPTPTPVFPLPSPAGSPVTIGNSGTAYQWPPGFGCSAANNLVGPPPVGQSPADWKMTFMEEFNTFDTNVWNDAVWYEQSNPTRNYTVEEGALKIWPQRDASGNFFNRTIDTDGKYYQTYGYFEIEAKLPIGKGTWPAFWLFNHIGDRRPEMDVMEAYAGGGPDSGWSDANFHPTAFAATVWRTLGDNAGHKTLQTVDLSQGFHTYAVKWEPGKQTYYFDGQPFWELDISMPDPMYLMLDLWYGSASGQPDDSTPQGKNNSYVVNYVRAWENCGSTGTSSGSAANGGSSATDGNTIGGNLPPATPAPASTPAPAYEWPPGFSCTDNNALAGGPGLGAPMPATRDPYKWPFASTSIWNTPIGCNAVYKPANFPKVPGGDQWAPMPQIDDEHIILKPDAPMTTVNYSNVGWNGGNRCNPSGGSAQGLPFSVPMPRDYIRPNGGDNASAVFLMPDKRTLIHMQPLARCSAGSSATALVKFPPVDIYGDGVAGSHGGSGMSAIGGSLRIGELRPGSGAPRHALKVNVYAREILASCSTRSECFRWPATTADSYAVGHYGSNRSNPSYMKMGALLAIPTNTDLESLGLESEPGKMLAWTLQNYGAYIVDDTWGPAFAINAEDGPDGSMHEQFKADWGYNFQARVNDNTPWSRDIQRLMQALHVVDNNGPSSIGGGGAPLQPPAPPVAPQ